MLPTISSEAEEQVGNRLGGDSSLDDVDSILSLEGVGIFRFELDKELQIDREKHVTGVNRASN